MPTSRVSHSSGRSRPSSRSQRAARAPWRTESRDLLTLVTGPTRSGKSRFAESLARECGKPVTYVATAAGDAHDPEWVARVAEHRNRRPAEWTTVETVASDVPLAGIVGNAHANVLLLIESLGTWLDASIRPFVRDDAELDGVALERELAARSRELLEVLSVANADVIVVAEQTGWGIVPPYVSARIFSSVLGRLTTAIARRAERSYLVVAGFAVDLRAAGTVLDVEENL